MCASKGLMKGVVLSLFLALLMSGGFSLATGTGEPEEVSIIAMIARPKEFDGKFVRVIGFVSCQFEGMAVFASREDWLHAISKNSIALELPEDELPEERCAKAGVDHNYGLIEGCFDAGNLGHKSASSGSLVVTRLEFWSRDAEPINRK